MFRGMPRRVFCDDSYFAKLDGVAKVLSLFAKRARGAMARYIIKNRLETPDRIKAFDDGGYAYRPDLSEGNAWVFTRDKD